ncbi:MAG: hypothetical protein H7240_10980 [Glaciimonas sp.]|nr:hypothetical protein [Glaciimonas sp.]
MGKLNTHTLEVIQGKSGTGVGIALYVVNADGKKLLKNVVTDGSGRSASQRS